MDPEMQNAIKKQLILRAVATGILIFLPWWCSIISRFLREGS